MAKVLFVHGMRMQGEDPDDLRKRWSQQLAVLLAATPWGKANPAAVSEWSSAELAYWGDLFAWERPPVDGMKGIDFDALQRDFYAIPRMGFRGLVRVADAIATFSDEQGRPMDIVATLCDSLVAQTAVYMNNGPAHGPTARLLERDFARYRLEPQDRTAYLAVQARVERVLTDDTRIVIGHSLGTVIAYEALCRRQRNVHTFVAIGSPMATPDLILKPLRRRLEGSLRLPPGSPLPWPLVNDWLHFYAPADVWCVPVPRLGKAIHASVRDIEVHHGTIFDSNGTHLLSRYLEHQEIGDAIANAIVAMGRREGAPSSVEVHRPAVVASPKPRRYFAAIGVGANPNMTELPEVASDLERMRGIFETRLEYESVAIPPEPSTKDLRDALHLWLEKTAFGPNDSVVLYYSGHGLRTNGFHYLCTSDFRAQAPGGSFKSQEIAEILNRANAPTNVWIILDCCDAGDGLGDLETSLQSKPGMNFALASTGSHTPSFDGAFSKAFVAVAEGGFAGVDSLNRLMGKLEATGLSRERFRLQMIEPKGTHTFDFLVPLEDLGVPVPGMAMAPGAAAAPAARVAAATPAAHGAAAAPAAPVGAVASPRKRAPRRSGFAKLRALLRGRRALLIELALMGALFGVAMSRVATCHRVETPAPEEPLAAAAPDATPSQPSTQAPSQPSTQAPSQPSTEAPSGMVLVPGGVPALGTDDSTARRMYAECVATSGTGDCGERFSKSVFARQIGWSGAAAIEVKPFALDAREVTRGDFDAWLDSRRDELTVDAGGGVHLDQGRGKVVARMDASRVVAANEPATFVSWYGADRYCRDHGTRLPSEVEWEFAARGAEGRSFAWGNDVPPSTGVAYAASRCQGKRCEPAAVGSSAGDRTREGVLDLAGNASEWTSSAFDGLTNDERKSCLSLDCRVVRGGSYDARAVWLYAAVRSRYAAAETVDNVGFRCARDAEP